METGEAHRRAAAWWQEFTKTNNAAFYPFIFDRHRYLVLMGGGGSGKSILQGEKFWSGRRRSRGIAFWFAARWIKR